MNVSKLDKAQVVKILKAALYLAVSSALAGFISLVTDTPELFGAYTPIVNVVLVTVKQFFTDQK